MRASSSAPSPRSSSQYTSLSSSTVPHRSFSPSPSSSSASPKHSPRLHCSRPRHPSGCLRGRQRAKLEQRRRSKSHQQRPRWRCGAGMSGATLEEVQIQETLLFSDTIKVWSPSSFKPHHSCPSCTALHSSSPPPPPPPPSSRAFHFHTYCCCCCFSNRPRVSRH